MSESIGFQTHISWVLDLSPEQAVKAGALFDAWSSRENRGASALARCESPAERLFLIGWLFYGERPSWYSFEFTDNEIETDPSVSGYARDEDLTYLKLRSQVDIGGYRVDFLLEESDGANKGLHWHLVVEIDGHDFHDRTKEQAARDRQRDRHLAAAGYQVIRFTGSEVYSDPGGCAAEAYSIATELRRRNESRWDFARKSFDDGVKIGEERTLAALVAPAPKLLPPKREDA